MILGKGFYSERKFKSRKSKFKIKNEKKSKLSHHFQQRYVFTMKQALLKLRSMSRPLDLCLLTFEFLIP
jgi:hypothetical protein